MQNYRTVLGESVGEYEEKRSKFIGYLAKVETEQQAAEFIAKVREQNREARHNVHAFVLKENGISRFSDDGEPHGTAGKPVLDVINGFELKNVCLVVTRYFGGILLGTGGLCRAYSAAAKEAALNAQIVTMTLRKKYSTVCEYSQYNKLAPLIEKCGGLIHSSEFLDNVTVLYSFKSEKAEIFFNNLRETFSGELFAECIGEEFAPDL